MQNGSVIKILEKLIGFDTTSHNSNLTCINYIQKYLTEYGVGARIIKSPDKQKACLFGTIGEGTELGVMLMGHTDVVPALEGWEGNNPFKLREEDRKLYGRGTCDMKGFIACALAMVPEFEQKAREGKLKQPIYLAFTYDEEIGAEGARTLMNFLTLEKIIPAWVWVGEPTNLQVIDSHKGGASFDTTITGLSGHSSNPAKCLDAVRVGTQLLQILYDKADELAKHPHEASPFEPPYTTITPSIVQAGEAENTISGKCGVKWVVRCHPGDDLQEILKDINRRVASAIAPRIEQFKKDHPAASSCGIETCCNFEIPPLLRKEKNQGVDALLPLTGQKAADAAGFGTDGGCLPKEWDVAINGPGDILQAHKPNEYVTREQLDGCMKLLRQTFVQG